MSFHRSEWHITPTGLDLKQKLEIELKRQNSKIVIYSEPVIR